jgi:hypothetical protein
VRHGWAAPCGACSSRVVRRAVATAFELARAPRTRDRLLAHRITGDRRHGSRGAGWEVGLAAANDALRPAHVEIPTDGTRLSMIGHRMLAWAAFDMPSAARHGTPISLYCLIRLAEGPSRP